jgi:hypothetical protein
VLQVYERGVDVFKFPVAFEIWNTYLTKFIARYVCHVMPRCTCPLRVSLLA